MYLPFVVLGAVFVFSAVSSTVVRRTLITALVIAAVISFSSFYQGLDRVSYPQNVAQQFGITDTNSWKLVSEYANCYPYPVFGQAEAASAIDQSDQSPRKGLTLVNFCYFYPFADLFNPFESPEGSKLVFSGEHFLSVPAYQFEGYSIVEREMANTRQLTVRIYEN